MLVAGCLLAGCSKDTAAPSESSIEDTSTTAAAGATPTGVSGEESSSSNTPPRPVTEALAAADRLVDDAQKSDSVACNTFNAYNSIGNAASPQTAADVQATAEFMRKYYGALASSLSQDLPTESKALSDGAQRFYAEAQSSNWSLATMTNNSVFTSDEFRSAFAHVSQFLNGKCTGPRPTPSSTTVAESTSTAPSTTVSVATGAS